MLPSSPGAWPLTVGVVSLVMPSAEESPVTVSIVSAKPVGEVGAIVSISIVSGSESPLGLPNKSCTAALRICTPSPSRLSVIFQVPPKRTVVVAMSVVSPLKVS